MQSHSSQNLQIPHDEAKSEQNNPKKYQSTRQLGHSLDNFNKKQMRKKILKKTITIMDKLKIHNSLTFGHVHNIFDMIGINEYAMSDQNYEESYFKTCIIEKACNYFAAQIMLKAIIAYVLILLLRQYLINRYKSFGKQEYYTLATALQSLADKIDNNQFNKKLMQSFDGQPLSRYIDSMQNDLYMCKVAPNRLVISRRLLQLLGEDPQQYAIQLCKYKLPIREIISAESYSTIIAKSLQNFRSVLDYVEGKLTFDELHAKTSINFTDYIYNRYNKKIYCNLILFMPTPQMSCIQVRQILGQATELKKCCSSSVKIRKCISNICDQIRFEQAEVLRHLTKIPNGLLKINEKKIAGFTDILSDE